MFSTDAENLSIESSGSRRYSGKLFHQMVGPATANERGP